MAKVSQVTSRAGITLNDTGNTSWTEPELLAWFNDGVRDTIQLDPSAKSKHAALTLVEGGRQQMPADFVTLIDVVCNINEDNTSGEQIYFADKRQLDAFQPKWLSGSTKEKIENVLYDRRDRKTFYVYPPAAAGIKIEVVHSYFPTTVTNVNDDLPLDDDYLTPLLDYLLWRAYSKDSKNPAYKVKAETHFAAYQAAVAAIVKSKE